MVEIACAAEFGGLSSVAAAAPSGDRAGMMARLGHYFLLNGGRHANTSSLSNLTMDVIARRR